MADLSDRDLERLFELDDAPGPARPVDDAHAAAIVAGALGGAGFPPGGGGGGGGGGGPAVRRLGAVRRFAGVKPAVLGGGAAVLLATVAWVAMRSPREVASPPPAPAIAATDEALPPAPPATPPAVPAESSNPVAVAPAAAEPPGEPPAKPTKRATGAHAHRHLPRAEPPAVAAAPADLLAEANAARGAHHWRAADALYARVVAGGDAALAVQTALVASGTLHLEHLGDPAGAAQRFRAALASGSRDPLAEDARWGLVEAARDLGDPAGELRALDDFRAHHAGSVRAARARARRVELGAPR